MAVNTVEFIKASTFSVAGKVTSSDRRRCHREGGLVEWVCAWACCLLASSWWPSMTSARHMPTADSRIITAKGRALVTVIDCSAFSPPASSSTAAITPWDEAQKIRCQTGVLEAPPAARESTTNEPESDEVTKNTTIRMTATKEVMELSGRYSSILNRAMETSFCTWLISWV